MPSEEQTTKTHFLLQRTEAVWILAVSLNPGESHWIGRSRANSITISDPSSSRQHAMISIEKGLWTIRDNESSNGTFLNGTSLTTTRRLKPGDEIVIGATEFLFADKQLRDRLLTSSDGGSPDTSHGQSVTSWIDVLKDQQGESIGSAQRALWQRYYDRLVVMAKRKLGDQPRRVEDEEDAVASAFQSFFEGVAEGEFPKLDNRTDLWQILSTIAARKVCRQIERRVAQKRGGGHVAGESVFQGNHDSERQPGIENAAVEGSDHVLSIEFVDTLGEYMKQLDDDELSQIATKRLHGFSNAEIAAELNVSERTVERKIRQIRESWLAFAGNQDE